MMVSVIYKTDADPDHKRWNVGVFPNKDMGLAYFNATDVHREGLGEFTFEETSPYLPDYHMVLDLNFGAMRPLYRK